MSDDLVNQLRDYGDYGAQRAADEIVRLRAEVLTVLEREAATTARHDAKLDALAAENDRLRDALQCVLDEDAAVWYRIVRAALDHTPITTT
jgi:formiminotetrahydrofolate cyclodeaminase